MAANFLVKSEERPFAKSGENERRARVLRKMVRISSRIDGRIGIRQGMDSWADLGALLKLVREPSGMAGQFFSRWKAQLVPC